jgi:APA family basic amino acid/polyamine antiporter
MTDLTSIGTLFAFALVCAGVLMLPADTSTNTGKRFKLPYINGRYIIPILLMVFLYGFRERTEAAFLNLANEPRQEILFFVFVILAVIIAVFTFMRKFSLIPVLGLLCCLYLMIEIPARSWVVFFGWMAFGLVIYFSYGYWKSKLAKAA